MRQEPLPRLDQAEQALRDLILPHCRLKPGEIWRDHQTGHVVGCGDACDANFVRRLFADSHNPTLAVHDPPYNLVMGETQSADRFADWCRLWIDLTYELLADNGTLAVWLGADQKNHFQPLPQFMAMMAGTYFTSRSFVTLRNQRGYGTQKNWMHVRQELLCYAKRDPEFEVQYTTIPRILKGYYKKVGEKLTENEERSRSANIRPGNVWVDIQQVFYRMEENVSGCYAQKPLKAIERIIHACSSKGETVLDFFAHSGTTLLAAERTGRSCVTLDIDPIMAEITIRRLEHFRKSGKTGWQASNPFAAELTPHKRRALRAAML